MSLRSRDNVQVKCTELAVIRVGCYNAVYNYTQLVFLLFPFAAIVLYEYNDYDYEGDKKYIKTAEHNHKNNYFDTKF